MQRRKKTKRLYDQSDQLHLRNRQYRKQVLRFIGESMREDIKSDLTTKKIISRGQNLTAHVIAKQAGVLAGMEEFTWLCRKYSIVIQKSQPDGSTVQPGSTIVILQGNGRVLFAAERTLVNLLQRMSGIATLTHTLKRKIGPYPFLAATRKTVWSMLDKKAVHIGGGFTHRLSLKDGIMVKDNHLALLKDIKDLRKIYFRSDKPKIVEVSTAAEFKTILQEQMHYDTILLDNFSPAAIRRALHWAKQRKIYSRYIFEASGGITENTISIYAKTGVDILSLGQLTHSAPALNISMDISQ